MSSPVSPLRPLPDVATSEAPAADASSAGVLSLPLSTRAASMLAYAAGWVSGALVLALEGRRREVRRHAAQALVGFGALSLIALALLAAAALSLFASITAFRVLLVLAQLVVVLGVGCWVLALVQTARGVDWRWPLVAPWADRLARLSEVQRTSPER